MQVLSETDLAGLLERLVATELPGGRGIGAWRSLLRAHATLMRQLETQLEQETGLALADYDVLVQLAIADGELRMTELANRALISRSGMTRRVARLAETVPAHARGIAEYFVSRLDDQELAVLESALDKVTVDCTFG